MEKQHAIEQAVISTSGAITKGSGGIAVTSGATQKIATDPQWLTFADWGVLVGIAGVIIGLGINYIYQSRRDRREQEIHQLTIRKLKRDGL